MPYLIVLGQKNLHIMNRAYPFKFFRIWYFETNRFQLEQNLSSHQLTLVVTKPSSITGFSLSPTSKIHNNVSAQVSDIRVCDNGANIPSSTSNIHYAWADNSFEFLVLLIIICKSSEQISYTTVCILEKIYRYKVLPDNIGFYVLRISYIQTSGPTKNRIKYA